MSLTSGHGPLSPDPAGRFSAPVPAGLCYVEPLARRVRAVLDGRTVIDSEGVLLVHRPGFPPTYAFPAADVDGVATLPEPLAPDHVSVAWDDVEQWWEEDEQVFGHPRNPYHRIECLRTGRRLMARVGGVTLVDTTDTLGVWETALAPKLYVERRHVLPGALAPSATTSYCPYKGTASWFDVVVGGHAVADAAWSYEDPVDESLAIGGLVCFDSARVDVDDTFPT